MMQAKGKIGRATALAVFAMGLCSFAAAPSSVFAQGLPPVIKVGVSASLTGPAASGGRTAKIMIDMAAKEINAAGGIAGRPVELVYADDEGDSSKAVVEVKRLIYQEKVAFVLGPAAGSAAMAAAPEFKTAKMLNFAFTGANTITPQSYPYGFGTFYSSDAFSDAMLDYAVDVLKAKAVAGLVDTGAQGRAAGEEFKIYSAKRGIKLVALESHDYGASDLTPQLLNLRRAGTDVILHVATTGDSVGRIYAGADQMGWHPTIISQVAATFPAQIKKIAGDNAYASGKILGPTFKSTTYCPGENVADLPFVKFLARLKAFTPEAGNVLVYVAPVYYDAIFLAKSAIEATKTLDGPTLAAWVEQNSTKNSGLGGVYGATKDYHLIWDSKAIAIVSRPDLPDPHGMLPRSGC
jgi:branched-chain amino acid transport system substrate-binding protein